MLYRDELADKLRAQIAAVEDANLSDDLLEVLRASLQAVEALDRVEDWDADYGEHAEPEDPDAGGPVPDPEGRFLMMLRSSSVKGGLWMRRYAHIDDLFAMEINLAGGGPTMMFEIVREIPHEEATPFIDQWFFGGMTGDAEAAA